MTTSYRSKGTVRVFNDNKGYGFIAPDIKNARLVFVHFSAIEGEGFKSLAEGQRVEYEAVNGPKGPQAIWVRRIEK